MSDPNTPYRHPEPESQLWNLHHAMDYNAAGEPVIRIVSSGSSAHSNGSFDAFGRQRVSEPFTLFDSQLRYSKRTDQYSERLVGSASSLYNVNASSLSLTVTSASGDKATRETLRVFAYQPGKSLQVMTTFAFDEGQTGLSQRVGYFNDQNGIFFANIDGVNCIVKRSYVTGSVVETVVPQSEWNVDTFDGTTKTGITLDATKAQIFFVDLEWLGVGSVRTGFVINGNFYVCHVFNHANIINTTYMTTACLPIRFEIENTASTMASSSMKQICATVISEGGYQIRGSNFSINRPITTPVDLTTAGTFYPIVSIRLRSDHLDGISLIRGLTFLGIGNNTRAVYRLYRNAEPANGTWVPQNGSSVEYNVNATAMSTANSTIMYSGIIGITNQSATAVNISGDDFTFQLERDGLSGTPVTYTLAATGAANGDDALGSIIWGELF
jgi:hypothetical protein